MDNNDVTTQTSDENADPQLTVADLQSMLVIIDTASKRGAFQASDLTQVGGVYEKIQAYVKHVSSK